MNDNVNPNVTFVYVGPLGDPKVVEAMMGHPVDVENVLLTGWEIKRQPLDSVTPENIRENIRGHWDNKGMPYLGSFTLVRNEKKQAHASKFSIPKDLWLKKRALIEDWGFHAPIEEGSDPWMKFDAVIEQKDGRVIGSYVTEEIINPNGLESVDESYWERDDYKHFVDQMVEGVGSFRQMIEGTPGSAEKSS